jgi:hypothetical protein
MINAPVMLKAIPPTYGQVGTTVKINKSRPSVTRFFRLSIAYIAAPLPQLTAIVAEYDPEIAKKAITVPINTST